MHFLIVALFAFPVLLSAQEVMPTRVVRGGADGLALSDGEPISFFLEHSNVLDLSDSQRVSLMVIRRKLRAANDAHMKQLDSIRELLGISLEPRPRGLSEDDRKQLQRFEQMSQPIKDSIKVNNDAARLQARSMLDSVQVARIDSLALRVRGVTTRRPPRR